MQDIEVPITQLPGNPGFEIDFISFVDRTILWFAKRAFRNQLLYNGSRVVLVVLSASLPVLVANDFAKVSTPIAIAIAILAGLDAQFKPGESWKHQRSAELTLRGLKRDYQHNLFDNAQFTDKTGSNPLDTFYRDVTVFLRDEPRGFWHSQSTTWSHQ